MAAALLSAIADGKSLVLREDTSGDLVLVATSRTGASVSRAVGPEGVGTAWTDTGAVLFGRLPLDTGFVTVEPDQTGAHAARVHLADGAWLAIVPAGAGATVVFHDRGGGEAARHRVEPPA